MRVMQHAEKNVGKMSAREILNQLKLLKAPKMKQRVVMAVLDNMKQEQIDIRRFSFN